MKTIALKTKQAYHRKKTLKTAFFILNITKKPEELLKYSALKQLIVIFNIYTKTKYNALNIYAKLNFDKML